MIESRFLAEIKITIKLMLICLSLAVADCNQRKDVRIFKAYYPFGALRKFGKIKGDSMVIDTMMTFWPNKKIQEIRVYDTNGVLNGCSYYFYPNGERQYVVCYKDDEPIGYGYEYYPNGNMKSKAYRLSTQVGNTYHYTIDGNIDTFSFFDFSTNILIEKHYTGQKLIRQAYKSYFLDTILPSSGREYLNLGFIVAKPPYE